MVLFKELVVVVQLSEKVLLLNDRSSLAALILKPDKVFSQISSFP